MKNKIKNLLSVPGIKYLIPSLLTVFLYYVSNNTADIVVFELWGIAATIGVFFFAFSFFLKDFIQKKFGTQFAIYNTIFAATLAGILFVESALVEGNGDYSFFLVLLVSVSVAIISETIDSLVFRKVFRKDTSRGVRSSLISNLVSVPIDTILFSYFAMYLVLGLPAPLVVAIAIGETVIKYIIAGVLAPFLRKVKAGEIWTQKANA